MRFAFSDEEKELRGLHNDTSRDGRARRRLPWMTTFSSQREPSDAVPLRRWR